MPVFIHSPEFKLLIRIGCISASKVSLCSLRTLVSQNSSPFWLVFISSFIKRVRWRSLPHISAHILIHSPGSRGLGIPASRWFFSSPVPLAEHTNLSTLGFHLPQEEKLRELFCEWKAPEGQWFESVLHTSQKHFVQITTQLGLEKVTLNLCE